MARQDFWMLVLDRLKPTIRKAHFITWFQNTNVMSNKDGVVKVGLPTSFALNWVSSKYGVKILQACQEVDESVKEVEYEVVAGLSEEGGVDLKNAMKKESKKVRKVRNVNEVRVTMKGEVVESKILNSRYTLDAYVIGQENRLPHAAAVAVASSPGGIYNPLYIYGNVGLGKTHLLQAIGNQALRNFPDKVVKYMTAEKFVSEVVQAISTRKMAKFKSQYRNVDVFLVDDIQFFARKDSSQKEFFHTFNELYDMNKQIVLASDRAPSELQGLDDRLKSRFAMGMVVELLFPEYETRLAILQQKCQDFEVIIDPEVLGFIANNVQQSVRELEGVLRQVVAQSQLENSVPTIRSAAEIIRRLNKAQEIIGFDIEAKRAANFARSADEVMNIVAKYYDLSIGDLVGKARHKEVMVPRQICMYLIKQELGESYEKIGEEFGGRNHTTVMHAHKRTAEKLKNDLKLVRDVNSIKREMGL